MDKYIGRLLDNRYEILEVLGTGGMAVVYKARCHRLNRLVAIKILKDDYMEDEEFRRRFHSESQAVAMLSHPNIVSIYDVSSSVTADYIVMELIDGITLKQYMEKKGVLNWKETLHFAIQIAKALEHAHGRGIVHRDIKPHNVMVLKNGSVKVTDFGIARMMSKGNTLTKEALGSVHYISPEQAKGGRVDSRSDIYSLGVVMYEMMSGRPPYDGESPVAVAIQHINGGAVLPSTLNPNIPGGLEQIIMKAMAHEPAKRFGSTADMLKDMDEFRKYPSVLFDYNTPPTDEVTRISRSPIVFEAKPAQTTAEKREQRGEGAEESAAAVQNQRTPDSNPSRGTQRDIAGGAPANWPPERRKPEPKRQKGGNAAAIAVISCSITIILALIVFLVIQFSGDDAGPELVKVPELVGVNYNLHKQYSDFEIKINEYVDSDKYDKDIIVKQYIAAGTEVEKNEIILVDVSKGKISEPQAERMPDLIGKDVETAKAKLDQLNLNLKVDDKTEEFNASVPAGHVIRTEPTENTELTQDMTVKLIISKGKEILSKSVPAPIANLLNWDPDSENEVPALTEADAKELIDMLQLGVVYMETVVEANEQIEKGNLINIAILRTDPKTGSTITLKGVQIDSFKTDDVVTFYISDGPKCTEMPDLRNKNKTEVHNIMQDLGIKYNPINVYSMQYDKDIVVSQSVEPGAMVPTTQIVDIEISMGPAVRNDIVIHLPEDVTEGEGNIIVTRDGFEIYKIAFAEVVDRQFQLPEQKGAGTVTYVITFNEISWTQPEVFSEAE